MAEEKKITVRILEEGGLTEAETGKITPQYSVCQMSKEDFEYLQKQGIKVMIVEEKK